MSLGSSLKAARTAANLTAAKLAILASVDSYDIESFESGGTTLSPRNLDRCACVLGLRVEDIEAWTGQETTLPVLLRDTFGPGVDLAAALATEVHLGLGEFQRTVRNIADLEGRLGRSVRPLPSISPVTPSEGGRRGEELADRARHALDLGNEPILSMRKLVEERLDIAVVWVTVEHLDPSIDGASTSAPRRAILVNLFEANRYPWRARSTLAHELCHVLFDHRERCTLFSPARIANRNRSQPLDAALARVETVARAFSACFLAPSAGVIGAVGSIDPLSEEAIRRVGGTYGVGRQLAINRIQHVFRLSDEQRASLELRAPEHYPADFSGDEVVVVDGFRGHPLRELVGHALAAGKIRPSRARRILGLAPTDALPFPELGGLSEPTTTRAESIRRIAQGVLRERFADEDLEALQVEGRAGYFRVSVFDGGIGCFAPRPRGYIDVSLAGHVSDVQIEVSGATK